MKILLLTFGSRGDVHPMLGLGRALRARGHEAVLLTNPAFRADTEQAGLGFVPVGSEDDYRQTLAHPKLWHPIDGLGVMWRYLLRPALRPTFDVLQQMVGSHGDTAGREFLVLASPLAMGARVAQEKLGIRLISTYTSATLLRSVQDPLTIAQWRVPGYVPHWARSAVWRLLDRAKLDPLVKPALESLRSELGLPPLAGRGAAVFDRWIHSPSGGLTLFPPWFAASATDWPPGIRCGSFPLYDDAGEAPDPHAAELQDFLARGAAPVVFMPGSAQHGTGPFFESAVAACRQAGLRGILLGQASGAGHAQWPDQFWSAPYFPFGHLLSQARAIVHHGGIGTSAQALRAGIPQLVWPQAYDQFDNAMRLERLGVGAQLRTSPVAAAELAQALATLLGSTACREACARWAAELGSGGQLDAACDWLEDRP